jgi:endonuclease G, mitochondrial
VSFRKKIIILLIVLLVFTLWYFYIYKPRNETVRPVEVIETSDSHILWGHPKGHNVRIFEYEGFVSGYDTIKLNPRWVSYNLKKEYLTGKKFLKDRKFAPDPALAKDQTAVNSDYTRSGYDRGHLARQANMKGRSKKCELEACYFTNVSPQKQDFNRVVWNNIEKTADNLTRHYGKSWIITGPYFDDDIILLNERVEIPDGFYKILVIEKENGLYPVAFVLDMNAKSINPEDYLVSVDSVEVLTGLDFFHELDDDLEEKLESGRKPLPYGWK